MFLFDIKNIISNIYEEETLTNMLKLCAKKKIKK